MKNVVIVPFEEKKLSILRSVIGRAAVVGLAMLGSASLAVAPVAGAAPGDLTCTISNGVGTFNPALQPGGTSAFTGNNPQLTGCFSLTGQTMTEGTIHVSGASAVAGVLGVGNCPLQITINGGLTISWNNGNPASQVDATLNTDPLNGTVGLDLRVTAGSLAGDSITPAIALTINLDCPAAGLTTLAVPAGAFIFA